MIPVYDSRTLSKLLNVPLAKWKRWAREFLPPDPLAGMQSGYARQYYTDAAFEIYLGGYLVSKMGVAIPTARLILQMLTPWREANGYSFELNGRRSEPADSDTEIYIDATKADDPRCRARTVVKKDNAHWQQGSVERIWVRDEVIGTSQKTVDKESIAAVRVLPMAKLTRFFQQKLQTPRVT